VIVVTGASGFIGRTVCEDIRAVGLTVCTVGRSQASDVCWPSGAPAPPSLAAALAKSTGVVHLAGESIGARWTSARRAAIQESRVGRTAALASAIVAHAPPSCVLVSGSAIGYYGDRGDEVLDEQSARGAGFLADVTDAWEAAAQLAVGAGRRVVLLRTGLVLGSGGGVLAKMRLPFILGLGGPLGNGRQWMSWIALSDLVRVVHSALMEPSWTGVINAVAPEPIRNADFTAALARAVRRPAVIPAPALALRLAFGQMASETLLVSQRVRSVRLSALGFRHSCAEIATALSAAISPPGSA